jgi:ligand-binding sensor domain-containing protein
VRAHISGGRAWLDAESSMSGRIRPRPNARLANLDFYLAPFKKAAGQYGVLDGLPANLNGRIISTLDGTIWLNTISGLSRFDGREFFNLTRENGLPSSTGPLSTYLDVKGVFWHGTIEGLWRYDPADGRPPAPFAVPTNPNDRIVEVTGTADGAIWWRTVEGELVRLQDGRQTRFTNIFRPEKVLPVGATYNPSRMAVAGNHLWLTGPGVGRPAWRAQPRRFGVQHGLLSRIPAL